MLRVNSSWAILQGRSTAQPVNILRRSGWAHIIPTAFGHGIGFTECLEGKTATISSDYDLPKGIAMMLDVGLFGVPEHFGARHENPHLINHEGESELLTELQMKVFA